MLGTLERWGRIYAAPSHRKPRICVILFKLFKILLIAHILTFPFNRPVPLLSPTYDDDALTRALGSSDPYVLGVFGRVGSRSATRVIHALSETGDTAGDKAVLCAGGMTPVRTVRGQLAAALSRRGTPSDADSSWSDLVRAAAGSQRLVLVIDQAHLIEEADRRFVQELAQGSKAAAADGGIPRIVLISDDRRFFDRLTGTQSPFHDPLAALTEGRGGQITVVEPHLLPYGQLALSCPRWTPVDLIRGAAIFGGQPEVLRWVEPDRSLGWNVTRLLLDPRSPLFDHVPNAIFARFQKTGRYGAVLSALAGGARTWQEVVRRTPEFGSGSPMGAYMKRLEERGFVRVHDSLDATAGSRRKRYALDDSFDAFWFRFVLPLADRLRGGFIDPADAWERLVFPKVDLFVAQVLPNISRTYVGRYAAGRLGAQTRIVGGLWGEEHDFDAAATLWDGSVVYSHCTWVDRNLGIGALQRARQQLRETRFGFGRERRTVLLIMQQPPSRDLEQAALRDPNVEWLDAERLVAATRSN